MTNLQSIALAELSLAMAAIRQNNSVKAAEYALSAVRTLETGGCGGCGAVFYSTDGAEAARMPVR